MALVWMREQRFPAWFMWFLCGICWCFRQFVVTRYIANIRSTAVRLTRSRSQQERKMKWRCLLHINNSFLDKCATHCVRQSQQFLPWWPESFVADTSEQPKTYSWFFIFIFGIFHVCCPIADNHSSFNRVLVSFRYRWHNSTLFLFIKFNCVWGAVNVTFWQLKFQNYKLQFICAHWMAKTLRPELKRLINTCEFSHC